MSRTYRSTRRRDRRTTRVAVRSVKAAFLNSGLALAIAAGAAAAIPADARAQECVTTIEKQYQERPGMESPLFVLYAWDVERDREHIAATHLQPGDCFIAAGAIINSGMDAGCVPMGRIATLGE